jgi:hypothetical protein
MREQRRVASVHVLRAERETAALVRQARLVLAVVDQFGTLLQILGLSTAMVFREQLDHPERERAELAVRSLAALQGRVSKIDQSLCPYLVLSLDAESELRRQ